MAERISETSVGLCTRIIPLICSKVHICQQLTSSNTQLTMELKEGSHLSIPKIDICRVTVGPSVTKSTASRHTQPGTCLL